MSGPDQPRIRWADSAILGETDPAGQMSDYLPEPSVDRKADKNSCQFIQIQLDINEIRE